MKLGLKLTDDSDLGRQMVRKHKAIKKCGSQKYETINNELYMKSKFPSLKSRHCVKVTCIFCNVEWSASAGAKI